MTKLKPCAKYLYFTFTHYEIFAFLYLKKTQTPLHMFLSTSSRLLKRLHWLPNRRRVKVVILTYAIRPCSEHQHLNSLLTDYRPTRSLRSAEEHLLVKPRTTSYSTSRAFSVFASNFGALCKYLENC